MLIDTHCHFDFPPFSDDVENCVQRYQQAGIAHIIVPAVSKERFAGIIELANTHSSIYYALGLHPIYRHQQSDLEYLNSQLAQNNSKLVAVGEIGLDDYIDGADLSQQLFFLSAQLDLAKQYQLPVILHSRKAHPLLYRTLKNAKLPNVGVIHGFSGSYEQAMQFIRLGFFIGVGGVISYPRANKTRNAISKIPLSAIILETDSPDMPLYGYQGQPNRPEQILALFDTLTTLRAEQPLHILNAILTNTLTLFSRINTITPSNFTK